MELQIISAVLLPFVGTTLGSALVFFLRGAMNRTLQRSNILITYQINQKFIFLCRKCYRQLIHRYRMTY